mmetsp:Transcript_12020/g.18208  ORF Transcript_12020/g.18208 Transcript_12020/m.18208 type:complete len:104 (-) Transcript_12020:419-730(-)
MRYNYSQKSHFYKHIKLSLVSTPVVGLVPLTSSLSQNLVSVLGGIEASVKSAPSAVATSNRLAPKYAPETMAFFKLAPSMEVSSRAAPLRSAPSKLVLMRYAL